MSKIDLGFCILFHEKVDQTIECLQSIIDSSNCPIYILNNNSSPYARKKLGEFCRDYSHITIFDSEKNLGVGVGRNYLINQTTVEWLFFLDNDITIRTQNWPEILGCYLKYHIEVDAFVPSLFNLHEGNYVTLHSIEINNGIATLNDESSRLSNSFPGGAAIVNRRVFEHLGIYDDMMFIGLEDFELAIRGILNNLPIQALHIPQIELIHDHRKVFTTEDKSAVIIRYDHQAIANSYMRISEKHGITINNDWENWTDKQINKMLNKSEFEQSFFRFTGLELNDVVGTYITCEKKCAIWGSGELGIEIIHSLPWLKESLDQVVDGDHRKHGMIFGSTRLTIQSPDILLKEKVDVIIVASVKYAEEIIKEIKQREIPGIIISILGVFKEGRDVPNVISPTSVCRTIPSTCTLYMTDICNLSCKGCSRNTIGIVNFPELDIPVVKKILECYPVINSFCIAGLGEPTLCSNFPEIVNYLKSLGKYVGIITNGTNINPIMSLKRKPDYISISLYGFDSQSYLDYSGVDLFDKVINNYRQLRNEQYNIGFSFIITKDNYQQLLQVLKVCDELNPVFLDLINYLAYDTSDAYATSKVITNSDEDILDFINRSCNGHAYVRIKPWPVNPDSKEFGCCSYSNVINVDGYGNISACQRQIGPDKGFGNLFDQEDCFNSDLLQLKRARISQNEFPHEQCQWCFGRMTK